MNSRPGRPPRTPGEEQLGRWVPLVLGLVALGAGSWLMLAALGLVSTRLLVSPIVAFALGLGVFLIGALFASAPFSHLLKLNARMVYRTFQLILLLFWALFHYAVLFGKSKTVLFLGPLLFFGGWTAGTQSPWPGYLVLAIVDALVVILYGTRKSPLPSRIAMAGEFAVLTAGLFALFLGGHLLGLYPARP